MGTPAPWRSSVRDDADATPDVLYSDTNFLIVAKPAGMPTTSPASGRPCLVDWVKQRLPQDARPHPTSRLDAPVSGIVTFALTSAANAHLLEARQAGTYRREYLGITTAPAPFDEATWEWPIAIDPRDRRLRIAGPGQGAREARTDCAVLVRSSVATLLRIWPKTGRTHQIRVHAKEAGAPLFGDRAYGGGRHHVLSSGEVVRAPRVMLHCRLVSFPTPDADTLTTEAPIPEDMTTPWSRLAPDEPALSTLLGEVGL